MKAAITTTLCALMIASCGGGSAPVESALDNDPDNPCLSTYYQTIKGRYSGSITLDALARTEVGPWQSCTWSVVIDLKLEESALGTCEVTADINSQVTNQSFAWPADLEYAHECRSDSYTNAAVLDPNSSETSIAVLDQIQFPQTLDPLILTLPANNGPYSPGVGGGTGTVDYIHLFAGTRRLFNSHTLSANGDYLVSGLSPETYGPIEFRTLFKE